MATGDRIVEPLETDALWRFSLAFYACPGVSGALIALQDRHALDVNLMLFALWHGVAGRGRLSSEQLRAADRAICMIRAEIVEPLRALRRRLKHDLDADMQRLRDGVKALELAGEKLAQTRLTPLAGPFGVEIAPDDLLASGHANLALYLGPERVRGAEAAVIRTALDVFVRV